MFIKRTSRLMLIMICGIFAISIHAHAQVRDQGQRNKMKELYLYYTDDNTKVQQIEEYLTNIFSGYPDLVKQLLKRLHTCAEHIDDSSVSGVPLEVIEGQYRMLKFKDHPDPYSQVDMKHDKALLIDAYIKAWEIKNGGLPASERTTFAQGIRDCSNVKSTSISSTSSSKSAIMKCTQFPDQGQDQELRCLGLYYTDDGTKISTIAPWTNDKFSGYPDLINKVFELLSSCRPVIIEYSLSGVPLEVIEGEYRLLKFAKHSDPHSQIDTNHDKALLIEAYLKAWKTKNSSFDKAHRDSFAQQIMKRCRSN